MRVLQLFFLIATLVALSSLPLLAAAQDNESPAGPPTPAPTLAAPLPIKMLAAGRGQPLTIDFLKLFPKIPTGAVQITKLPTGGKLLDGKNAVSLDDEKLVVLSDTKVVYRSRDDFPNDGKLQALDSLDYRLVTDSQMFKGTLQILVNNRQLEIHDYNLRAIDDSARLLTLNVRDGRTKLTLKDAVLKDVRIETLPTGGCTVQQFDKTTITQANTTLTDSNLRVWVLPEEGSPVGTVCTFTYTALRRNGVRTAPATVRITRQLARAPRAYNTVVNYQVDFDTSRTVELIGVSGNTGRNLTFQLTAIPAIGQLFDVTETASDELPTKGIEAKDLPLTLYQGPKTRVALVYRIVNPQRLRGQKLAPVFVSFTVTDGTQTSPAATVTINLVRKESPVCGQSIISPVFWDQPVKNVVLNFTTPNGLRVQRIVLLSTPAKPIGDLTFLTRIDQHDDRRQQLRVGSIFSDNDKRLQYLVRRENIRASGNDTFSYRVQTFNGMSCVGKITFQVLQHDARRPPAGISVRRELVRVNSITLLPMWGQANASMAPTAIRVTSVPSYGRLFRVSSLTKYDPGHMYRVSRRGDQLTYCRRHDCTKLLDGEVQTGDVVDIQTLFEGDSLRSDTRIWLFYQSPKSVPNFQNVKDTFSYVFVDKNGGQSTPQRVELYYRKALKRVIDIRYALADVRRNQNFDHQAETIIPCVLSNASNQRVMIPQFDKYRRHEQKEEFRLFQYRKDGNRIYNGERLTNSSVGGVVGQWLEYENTVILIPSARARKQRFQFRAIIYNVTNDGQLDASTREEVRVVVTRENSVPLWMYEQITGRGSVDAYVGSMATIDLAAYDDDDDLLSFRVGEGVKLGSLFYEKESFGLRTLEQLKSGSIVRIPKGSIHRSDVRLQYLTNGAPSWTFPLYDNFTMYADDGGGILSDVLMFNITIVGDQSGRAVVKSYEVSLGFVGVAAFVAIAMVVVMIVLIRRRMNRRRYMAVPQDVELN